MAFIVHKFRATSNLALFPRCYDRMFMLWDDENNQYNFNERK
jgi:hypothetical protein